MRIKTIVSPLLACPQPTLLTSLLLSPQASLSTWTLLSHSLLGCQLRPQWSTSKSLSQSLQPSQLSLPSSVSCSSPPVQYALLSKGTGLQEERNSSSLHKDWLELCAKIKKSAVTTKNSLKYSSSEAKIWQNARHMQLIWKKPMNIGKKTLTEEMQSGRGEDKHQKDMRRTKATSLISSSQSLMAITPCMSLPPTSSWMASTAWAPSALTSPSIGTNFSHPSTLPSKKRENSLTGSLQASPMTPCTQQCTTTQEPRKTGESQLSSNDITICMLKLLPWSQSKGAWLLPSRQLRSSWIRANDICLAPMPMSDTNYSVPSMRAPTSTKSPRGSSPLSLAARATVRLDPDQRVMSQGGLHGGKRTTKGGE